MSRRKKLISRAMLAVVGAALTYNSAAIAKPTPADLEHPELTPDAMLANIIPELQKTFIDPASTQAFQLCRPHQAKLQDGQLISWAALFVANTKNAAGGYAGRTIYTAIYKKGRMLISSGTSLLGNQQGFDMLIAREMERQTSDCPRIADDRIKELLAR